MGETEYIPEIIDQSRGMGGLQDMIEMELIGRMDP